MMPQVLSERRRMTSAVVAAMCTVEPSAAVPSSCQSLITIATSPAITTLRILELKFGRMAANWVSASEWPWPWRPRSPGAGDRRSHPEPWRSGFESRQTRLISCDRP